MHSPTLWEEEETGTPEPGLFCENSSHCNGGSLCPESQLIIGPHHLDGCRLSYGMWMPSGQE